MGVMGVSRGGAGGGSRHSRDNHEESSGEVGLDLLLGICGEGGVGIQRRT